jgi:hypothetical protein
LNYRFLHDAMGGIGACGCGVDEDGILDVAGSGVGSGVS